MNKTAISFLIICAVTIHGEQRNICYSGVDNKHTNSSYAVFYQNARSFLSCGVQCSNDVCCVWFIYNETSKQCFGVHHMDNGVQTSKESTALSNTTHYRKGCESDWIEFKGHSYFFGKHTAIWSDAKMECKKKCSYLVNIEDIEEAEWLSTTFLKKDDCSTNIFNGCTSWTGGNDLNVEGEYVWDHSNTTMVFTNWHTNEPSLTGPSLATTRDCIDILRNGKWNDRPCLHLNSFICEKSIDF